MNLETVCQLIADTMAKLSVLEWCQKVYQLRIYDSSDFSFLQIGLKIWLQEEKKKIVFNSGVPI